MRSLYVRLCIVIAKHANFIMNCSLVSDDSFGPQYCDDFDFTLVFEQSFFQIAPCALLLFALPIRASQLRRQEAKCAKSWTRLGKQAIISFLALSQCALLISWALSKSVSRTAMAAASLSFLACLGLLWLSSVEHTRSARPSDIISVFTLISIILDVPQARTLWLRHRSDTAVAATFTACLAIKIGILFLEARSKRPWLLPPYRSHAPEALANVFDRTVLWWLGPLFLLTYRKNISFEDLYAIDESLRSESVEERFMQHWSRLRKPNFHIFPARSDEAIRSIQHQKAPSLASYGLDNQVESTCDYIATSLSQRYEAHPASSD